MLAAKFYSNYNNYQMKLNFEHSQKYSIFTPKLGPMPFWAGKVPFT